jgi:Holliday junction resolvase
LKPERKFYEKIRKSIPQISWIRLENNSLLGTPDLLAYNTFGHFFTVELKVTKGNKVRFSPHQISFHVKHPNNTFIMVQHLGSGAVKLFRGQRIMELEACGFELDACSLGLDACGLMLEALGSNKE